MYFIFLMYVYMCLKWDFCSYLCGSFSMLSYLIQLINYRKNGMYIGYIILIRDPLMCTMKHPILAKHLTMFGMLV